MRIYDSNSIIEHPLTEKEMSSVYKSFIPRTGFMTFNLDAPTSEIARENAILRHSVSSDYKKQRYLEVTIGGGVKKVLSNEAALLQLGWKWEADKSIDVAKTVFNLVGVSKNVFDMREAREVVEIYTECCDLDFKHTMDNLKGVLENTAEPKPTRLISEKYIAILRTNIFLSVSIMRVSQIFMENPKTVYGRMSSFQRLYKSAIKSWRFFQKKEFSGLISSETLRHQSALVFGLELDRQYWDFQNSMYQHLVQISGRALNTSGIDWRWLLLSRYAKSLYNIGPQSPKQRIRNHSYRSFLRKLGQIFINEAITISDTQLRRIERST